MKLSKLWTFVLLTSLSIFLNLFIWILFYANIPQKIGFPKTSLETIYANYDGPNYMVIAKCGYQKSCIASKFSLPLPLEYYPAHLPGYPLLIKYFNFYVNTPKAMLLASLVGSILLTNITYIFFTQFLSAQISLWLTILSIFFPARLFILRFVGAPETWFISFILASIVLHKKQKYFYSAVTASLALLLKSPGVLLFLPYLFLALKEKQIKKYLPYLLIPLTGLAIFYTYYLQTGDFLAYFHSGDNIHLNLWPYLVFISNHTWINTIWLEDVIFIYFAAIYGLTILQKKYKLNIIFLFPLVYTIAAIFVAHRDISRYISPVYPFLILAFSEFLSQKTVKKIFILILPAIILYAVNFLVGNAAPIADWTPYL